MALRSLSCIPDSIVTMLPGLQEPLGRHCRAARGAVSGNRASAGRLVGAAPASVEPDGTSTNCVLTGEIRSYLDESFLYRTHHSLCQQGRWQAGAV